ncbi:MAG: DUF305 domain-containing protein [Alphaproteobacteria bacterium]|nr:DUF305 domain-containing protein [Alphaproteobacteria bacterium]
MRHTKHLLAAIAVLSIAGGPAIAQTGHHAGMHHTTPKLSKKLRHNPAVREYIEANATMHKGMDIVYSGNADVDFARGMIPHHQGAVDMAKVQIQYGKDEELKKLTRRIITWQEAEIGFMTQWLATHDSSWVAEGACSRPSVRAYKEGMDAMHRDMAIKFTGDADLDFVRGMIPHHQGAIDMAWVLKAYGSDPALRKLADEIIRSQAQEIQLMKEWLEKHGNT